MVFINFQKDLDYSGRKNLSFQPNFGIGFNIENFEMELIEAGLEKMEVNIDLLTVYCPFSDFNSMQLKIEELKAEIIKAEILRVPNNLKDVSLDQAKEVIKL